MAATIIIGVVGHDMAHCRRACPKRGLCRPHGSLPMSASFLVVVARIGLSDDIDPSYETLPNTMDR
jgi:hypothetical protein